MAEGVIRLSRSEGWPRPWVGVCGSIHGNEPCGGEAVADLRREIEGGGQALEAGTLYLIHANPEASRQGLRHTADGADLNRLWDFAFETALRRDAWGYEHHRARELAPVLETLDVLLDVHSAFAPTPAFAVTNGLARADRLARQIGAAFVVRAWDDLADKVIVGALGRRDVPALSVECGAHADPGTVDVARRMIRHFLEATGVLRADEPPALEDPVAVRVVETITRPSEAFRFSTPWRGFQKLDAGTVLGRDEVTEIRVGRACYAVLPNDTVAVGEDTVYLAVDDAPDESVDDAPDESPSGLPTARRGT